MDYRTQQAAIVAKKDEIDITIEILKKYADECNNWNEYQKEAYKLLADYAKEQIKRNING